MKPEQTCTKTTMNICTCPWKISYKTKTKAKAELERRRRTKENGSEKNYKMAINSKLKQGSKQEQGRQAGRRVTRPGLSLLLGPVERISGTSI